MNDPRDARRTSVDATSLLGAKAFRDAVFNHPDFALYVIAVQPDGSYRFEDANAGVARLANRSLEEIPGCRPQECLIEPIADCLVSNLDRCVATGETLTYQRELDLPDGRLSWKTTLMPAPRVPGDISHVVGITRDITYESRMEALAVDQWAMLKGLEPTLPNVIYLYDYKTRAVRFTAGQASRPLGYRPGELEAMGGEMIENVIHPDDMPGIEAHQQALATLADGECAQVEYRALLKSGEYRHMVSREMVFRRNVNGEPELIFGVNEDRTAEDEVRDLSRRLLVLQMEERRLIAQELHDSTAQHLIAVDFALSRIRTVCAGPSPDQRAPPAIAAALAEAREALDAAKRDIRVQTFLLHPPRIASHGLAEAITAFAMGFGTRAGLEVATRIDPVADELGDEAALSLFRICQEALANIHRHSRATRASVTLDHKPGRVVLTIADDGIGIDEDLREKALESGVGLTSMSERMMRLGGSLELLPGDPGTKIVATAPWLPALQTPRPPQGPAAADPGRT